MRAPLSKYTIIRYVRTCTHFPRRWFFPVCQWFRSCLSDSPCSRTNSTVASCDRSLRSPPRRCVCQSLCAEEISKIKFPFLTKIFLFLFFFRKKKKNDFFLAFRRRLCTLTTGTPSTTTVWLRSIMSKASRAMQRTWSSQGSGSPLTAMYLSPTVSTWKHTKNELICFKVKLRIRC